MTDKLDRVWERTKRLIIIVELVLPKEFVVNDNNNSRTRFT